VRSGEKSDGESRAGLYLPQAAWSWVATHSSIPQTLPMPFVDLSCFSTALLLPLPLSASILHNGVICVEKLLNYMQENIHIYSWKLYIVVL
jgi:hypothetical protein